MYRYIIIIRRYILVIIVLRADYIISRHLFVPQSNRTTSPTPPPNMPSASFTRPAAWCVIRAARTTTNRT